MDRKDAIAWVVSVCAEVLRGSQAKTLSILVAATLSAPRLTLAGIGREAARTRDASAKHALKRAWRFTANPRVEPAAAMPDLMSRLWRKRLKWHAQRPDRRPLLISPDGAKVRRLHTLMAAVVVEGRALPLWWQSYRSEVEGKSQNALEYAMLPRIKAALPGGLRVVVLADRGFGRA